MNNNTEINWLAVIPLGLLSLFFLLLGLRAGARFFGYKSSVGHPRQFRDIVLLVLDLASTAFSTLMAVLPIEGWLATTLCGLGFFIVGSLIVVLVFIPKLMGSRANSEIPHENNERRLAWYEFTPVAFLIGLIVFSLVGAVLSFLSPLPDNMSTMLSAGVGAIVGMLISLIMFLKARTA